MNKIHPCIWFDTEAEDAANFYASVFKNSKILNTSYYSTETPSDKPTGSVLTVTMEIEGTNFMFLNGGPIFKANEAISFVVNCEDQEEIDYYWDMLSAVPESEQCGWLKDKFGISWQIVPKNMGEIIGVADPEKAKKGMEAMLQMKKIIINELEDAVA
jgi:predicted 3-demethylubiquinone-9 3-methyltransferase (glyoxalase superfamily)